LTTGIPKRGSYNEPRNISKVYIIGGTHGNERTGVHAVQYIREHVQEFTVGSITKLECLYGNFRAIIRNSRYIEKDLNRCFRYDYASVKAGQTGRDTYEGNRALEIRAELSALKIPAEFVLDLHTTTSNMGNCIIVSDDDPWTEYLCCLLRKNLPNCKILFEPESRENEQTSSSLGLNHITLEMGSVPQGMALYQKLESALNHIKLILNTIHELNGKEDIEQILKSMSVIKYIRTPFDIDYPRDNDGLPIAMIHQDFAEHTYKPLIMNQPVFTDLTGKTIFLEPGPLFSEEFCSEIKNGELVPLFIGEAAYVEKGIAFTTAKDSLPA